MLIRQLKKIDELELKNFFTGLGEATLYNWNRFGDVRNKKKAVKIAHQQIQEPLKEEKGFVAINDLGEIMGYGYLRYFPEKKQKKYTTSLGIVVRDRFQAQGIGTKLVNYMLEDARKSGMKKV